MAPRQGQELLLASASVLQQALLPHLSAVSLLRLSLSCKALRAWILDTPPSLWQVRI